MTFIEAIREAISACLAGWEATDIIYATYTDEGLKIDDTLIYIPMEFVDLPEIFSQNGLKAECIRGGGSSEEVSLKVQLQIGDRLAVAVHHGGQRYSVLYRIG